MERGGKSKWEEWVDQTRKEVGDIRLFEAEVVEDVMKKKRK